MNLGHETNFLLVASVLTSQPTRPSSVVPSILTSLPVARPACFAQKVEEKRCRENSIIDKILMQR